MACSVCKSESAASVWVQAFRSFTDARNSGSGLDFLSALMPGPGLLKIEVCLECPAIRPCVDLSEEEKKEMQEYVKQQEKRGKVMGGLGKVFGS